MGEGREKDEAFVTLATNDTYALGCLVLANSLRRVGTSRQLVVMITQGVSSSLRDQLAIPFDHIVPVNVLDSNDSINLELLGRPDLSVTFTKLHCWRLTQFKKCVFMDADTLVLQNIDELFDREELSAAPDPGWPDCFNSGVFVYVPSDETYRSLLTFAITTGSFDGGDQGLLNLYFRDWATRDIGKHLPFIYNVVSQIFYSYLPALKQFHDKVKVVHFIGAVKPWHHSYNTATGRVASLQNTQSSQEYLQLWWDLFMESVQPNLDPQIAAYVRLEYIPPTPPASESVQVSGEASGDQGNGQQQQRQQDHHGHTDIRAAPTTSYHVLFPYTPPNLEEPHQVAPQPMVQDAATKSEVIDIPVVYRDYKSYETHYAEEPLTAVNPENPPVDHYIASEEIKGPHFTYDEDRNYSDEKNIPSQGPAGSSQNNRSIGEVTKEGTQTSLEGGDARNMNGLSGSGEKDENGNDAAKGGIVGELANLSISGDEAIRGDRERKLQWEQGQADYMGIDSFDHIRARLDEKIAQPTPSTSRTSVEKETTSKEKEVTSKEKEVRSKQ